MVSQLKAMILCLILTSYLSVPSAAARKLSLKLCSSVVQRLVKKGGGERVEVVSIARRLQIELQSNTLRKLMTQTDNESNQVQVMIICHKNDSIF